MSYVRRRQSLHYYIIGHRVRKDSFWRVVTCFTLFLLAVLIGAGWTVYLKDQNINQAASRLLEQTFKK